MSVEVIPAGASVVVKQGDRKELELMEAIKDAQAQLERAVGASYADNVKTMKDVEANLERAAGANYADTVKTVKDTEAQLDRSAGDRFMQTVQDVKDAETRLHKDAGDKFINTIQDVKDAETRLNSSAADRFIQTIQDIKDGDFLAEKSRADKFITTIRDIKDAAKDTALAAAENKYEIARQEGRTRELVITESKQNLFENAKEFCSVKKVVEDGNREIMLRQVEGFKDQQALSYRLSADAEKTAYINQSHTMLQFKEQALLTERLAAAQALLSEKLAAQASRELAECCCEIRTLVVADGNVTRALINANETQNLRDRAARVEAQLAVYVKGSPPAFP